MTMPQLFDAHATIRKLAKWERQPFLDGSGTGIWRCPSCRQCSDQPHAIYHTDECQRVPFAALRAERDGIWSHKDCTHVAGCQNTFADGSTPKGVTHCQGRGWVPEPDVEKACWRVMKTLRDSDKHTAVLTKFPRLYTSCNQSGRITIGSLFFLWAAMTILLAGLGIVYNPEWSFGDVMQVVVASLVMIGVLPTGFLWLRKQLRKRRLFTIEHQPSQDEHLPAFEGTLAGLSRIHLTIRPSLDTQVLFVALRFDGKGEVPQIFGLDDWLWGQSKVPPNIYAPYSVPGQGNTWYWTYQSAFPRIKDHRITIGVNFHSERAFVGSLRVGLTTLSDGAKNHCLPVVIRE